MRSFLSLGVSLSLLSSCFTTSSQNLEFKTSGEAEAYLRKHKACPGCNLYRAELSYADLRGADLHGANLRGADFTRADLRGANLKGAILVRADLSTGTLLEGADLSEVEMTGANIETFQLGLAKTCGAVFPSGDQALPCQNKN